MIDNTALEEIGRERPLCYSTKALDLPCKFGSLFPSYAVLLRQSTNDLVDVVPSYATVAGPTVHPIPINHLGHVLQVRTAMGIP